MSDCCPTSSLPTPAVAGPALAASLFDPCKEAIPVVICGTTATPVANIQIEFSETLVHSASTDQTLLRVREYSEATGLWALRYENLDGTAFTGTIPADLTVTSAQVQVVRNQVLGCSAGQAYVQRTTSRFDSETGALESEVTDWIDNTGVVLVVAPAGWGLGPCATVTGTAQVPLTCNAVGTSELLGPILVADPEFLLSSGSGASSGLGPGWSTTYTASADLNIAPGSGTFAFFDSNLTGVTNNVHSVSTTKRTLALSTDGASALEVKVYLQQGKTYRPTGSWGYIGSFGNVELINPEDPFFPLTSIPQPAFAGNIQSIPTSTFVWFGGTGERTIQIVQTGTSPGDILLLRDLAIVEVITAARASTNTPVAWEGRSKVVIEQVLETAGCNDNRRDKLLVDVLTALTKPVTPEQHYAQVYRLAWDQAGIATPTTGAGTPAGAVVGNDGNAVTITGPVKGISWKWLPATAPIPDVANPPDVLNPTVTVNGLAYVATVPNPIFSQSFSHSVEVNTGTLVGDWMFTATNGAYIEITVIKAV